MATKEDNDGEFMTALADLTAAAMRVADAFPHYGEANDYPPFLPDWSEVTSALIDWRNAERDCRAAEQAGAKVAPQK